MRVFEILGSAIVFFALVGCGERSKAPVAKGKQATPEQVACIQRVMDKRVAAIDKFMRMYVEALSVSRSTVDITLAERRANEELCAEETKCYGLQEPIHSLMFESCLEEAERKETGG